MTFADGWTCRACWKGNRAQDPLCYRCKTPRDADEETVEATRAAAAARGERPEAVPDIVVALPVVIFRAFNVLAPDILSPTAIRWTSVIVFGGAGLAPLAGAVLIFIRREDP
jgi:hypothetical protein